MAEFSGWLLDMFEDPGGGIILWFIGEDSQRIRLRQPFPLTFYASGTAAELRALESYLRAQPFPSKSAYAKRRDLYKPGLLNVLSIQTQPAA